MIQPLFPSLRSKGLREALSQLSNAEETERGAVYTRPEVVHAMLDLLGYRAERPLHRLRLLEPAFGGGDFLLPAVERLLLAFEAAGGAAAEVRRLADAVRGVELHEAAFVSTRARLISTLVAWGCSQKDAVWTVDRWVVQDDFLLWSGASQMDFVVGNPPYVRHERIPGPLLDEYRRRFRTIRDRADLYVPFIERGLDLLAPKGRLAYICANRWLKNKYGQPLRAFAASDFHLRYFIDLEGAPAFHSDVLAYPAITVFERGSSGPTCVARRPEINSDALGRLVDALTSNGSAASGIVEVVDAPSGNGDPWILEAPDRVRLLRRLEARLPEMELAGCRVGIGVATGLDRVFIGKHLDLPVEEERKLPLANASDLDGTTLRWSGWGLINPFEEDGTLASLETYPRFGAYMREHRERLAARHCAVGSAHGWYRTIDRVWPSLATTPKLLIPDIKGEPTVVYDEGKLYPHHNLYYVLSDTWDLRALATVLRSSVAVLFIAAYGVRMGGGYLRFQAQYLRRIRLPRWEDLNCHQRSGLVDASASLDLDKVDAAVGAAYGLAPAELDIVRRVSVEARVPRRGAR